METNVNDNITNDVRSFNVGASDYSKHKYQSWDFWLTFRLNPFDADLCKRILRTKATDGRLLDYQKIKHICSERLRQLDTGADVWGNLEIADVSVEHFEEMIEDYNLCEEDKIFLTFLLMPVFENRITAYIEMIKICDKRITELT